MESKECIQYHEYMSTLAKMSRDESIPIFQRWTAGFLSNRIETYHLKKCVYEYKK